MAELILKWDDYRKLAREVVSEGVILLENNGILPFENNEKISIFGRIQTKYYKSGTGSGGMVNVSNVVTIPDGLRESGKVTLNEKLFNIYTEWEKTNPFNEGVGWGTEPWSQIEMPLSESVVKEAAEESDVAIVIIGRTAGEDKDITLDPGAYLLNDEEKNMLSLVRKNFSKMVIILNTAALMDLSMIDEYKPDAAMLVWTGGMEGGYGIADVLTGKCPSGRLPDTVAYNVSDYPAYDNYGDLVRNYYAEDIFVGYRYFETFAKDKVRYPFGYGLSYTEFNTEFVSANVQDKKVNVTFKVTNTGKVAGKQVVQLYVKAPLYNLSKAEKVLVGFAKTNELKPSESQQLTLSADFYTFASFDDGGVTGHRFSWIVEKGQYELFLGDNVRNAESVYKFSIEDDIVFETLQSALAPVLPFKRMTSKLEDGKYVSGYEDAPLSTIDEIKRKEELLPEEIKQDFSKNYNLKDVYDKKITMEEFVSTLTDDDLVCIVRGEGMGSALVTPGTASAFAGVSKSLRDKGVPAVCCDDGPSGMRLDSGALAFSLPSGILLASTYNCDIVEKLYEFLSIEMKANKVECLLGPGMNIHRHVMNGRNFEYFSEDPYLTGMMAAANLNGLNKYGVTGTAKHFCANNQELSRLNADAVISERALREIYLKGYEMITRMGVLKSVMTTYGSVNGLWTAGNPDLNTVILRNQWGFKGIVMTDWWAKVSERDVEPSLTNFAQMVRAQNDLYMCCPDAENNPRSDSVVIDDKIKNEFATSSKQGDNLVESLEKGTLKRSELQRSAVNILNFAVETEAFKRINGMADKIVVEGREDISDLPDISLDDYIKFDEEITVSLTDKESVAGTDYMIPLEIEKVGYYDISLTGSSELNEVAQLPCTIYYTGVPFASFTFSGTGGKPVTITKRMPCHNRFGLFRLNVAANGLKLESLTFKYVK